MKSAFPYLSKAKVRHLFLPILGYGLISCAPSVEFAEISPVSSRSWEGAPPATEITSLSTSQDWAAFGSSELLRLIGQARQQNPEIGIAAARITQARGALRIADAALEPVLNVDAGTNLNIAGSGNDNAGVRDIFGGINIGYELDLFGRLRSGRRADQARFLAAGFDAESVSLLVEVDVARTYFQYVTLTQREEILERALTNARELERVIQIRFEEGVATRVDLGLQRVEVRNLQADRSRLAEARIVTRNALAVLVGSEAPYFSLNQENAETFQIPVFGVAQPSDLLVRRPDIRANEARIRATEGDVRAARAAFLPSINISSSGIASTASLSNPISFGLNIATSLLAPIFFRGRLRGDLTQASGIQMEAVQNYRLTLLTAFSETENALARIEQSSYRLTLLNAIVEEAQNTAMLAREQFVAGAVDSRTALESERELLESEENYALALQDNLNAAIDLYRAMGGRPDMVPSLPFIHAAIE